MKINFIIALLFCTLIGHSQSDTIVYFTKLNKTTGSKKDAIYYSELMQGKKGLIVFKEYALKESKWTTVYEANVQRVTDSSYSYNQIQNKKQIYIRYYSKKDSGYLVRDYLNNKLISEGLSRLIFPLIREGHWKQYSQVDGKLKNESEYIDNKLISNIYYVPGGSYIYNVFTYVDKNPEYEGGDYELLKFIGENTIYPDKAKENNITGRVIISFILMADGSIQGLDFLQRVDILLDAEALRVVSSIPKNKWKPAEIDSKKVNMPMVLPITFSIH
jgi:TonB family protein